MKTAVSIPDDIFEEADRLAHDLKISRSSLFSRALAEYLARHTSDRITEALDLLVDDIPASAAEADFAGAAARAVLEKSEW